VYLRPGVAGHRCSQHRPHPLRADTGPSFIGTSLLPLELRFQPSARLITGIGKSSSRMTLKQFLNWSFHSCQACSFCLSFQRFDFLVTNPHLSWEFFSQRSLLGEGGSMYCTKGEHALGQDRQERVRVRVRLILSFPDRADRSRTARVSNLLAHLRMAHHDGEQLPIF